MTVRDDGMGGFTVGPSAPDDEPVCNCQQPWSSHGNNAHAADCPAASSVEEVAAKLDDWASTIETGRPGPSAAKLRRYAHELRDSQ